jgi:hypothetical protein
MDELTVLTELGDVAVAEPAPLASARAQLVAEARGTPSVQGSRRRVPGRVLAAAAAFTLAGSGAAYAGIVLTQSSPSSNTTIECGYDTYIPTESGNPVADCHAALAREGGVVPPLIGWVSPTGLVVVLPRGDRPPAGSTPLPSAFEVSAGVRFVTDALGDQVGPFATGCLAPAAAVADVRSLLALAGLTEWSVSSPSAGGSASCLGYAGVVEPASQTVVLAASAASRAVGGDPGSRLDARLRAQLEDGPSASCLSSTQAIALAEQDAGDLGIAADALTVSDGGAVGSAARTCAEAFVVPAGFVDVIVWEVPAARS